MKISLFKLFPALILCITSLSFIGCESESASNYSSISTNPRSASLRKGESVVITASGGWDYKWSLENSSIGSLNQSTGNQVIYTARSNAENSVYLTGIVSSNKTETVEFKIHPDGISGSSENSISKENNKNQTQNNIQLQSSTLDTNTL